jgi:TrmH family RNA methyltransferase
MITSLHSPHVEEVKALLGSRGVKERRERSRYVIEGESNLRAILECDRASVEKIYFTAEGISRLQSLPADMEMIEVSPQVMSAMSDTVTSQGVLAVAKIHDLTLVDVAATRELRKVAYFWQIQDPGNAGTVIRTAAAFGFDLVIFSDNSVDCHSPKVVRATAGALWQIPVIENCTLADLTAFATATQSHILKTDGVASLELKEEAARVKDERVIWVFGNEARGIPDEVSQIMGGVSVRIPMLGATESLNLATAAAVVMYEASRK